MTHKKAKIEDILEGIDFVSAGRTADHEAFLCRKTGIVYFRSENLDEPLPKDLDESENYLALPSQSDLGLGKPLAVRFTGETLPEALGRVHGFFSRPGGYGRFKFLLEREGKLAQWYEYERKALEAAVRDWCREHGVEVAG